MGQKGIHSRRCRIRRQLLLRRDALSPQQNQQQHKNDVAFFGWRFFDQIAFLVLYLTMNKSIKIGLIGIIILVVLLVVILLVNLKYSSSEIADVSCLKLDGGETCHSSDRNAYRYYGTKTIYDTIRFNDTEFLYGDCDPQLFYLFSRHGIRYPDEKDIKNMGSQLPILKEKILTSCSEFKCNLCENDVDKLKAWTFNLKTEDENQLSENGKQEAFDLALRFRKRFPTLLDRSYSPGTFMFGYTSRTRSEETAKAFARGLFGTTRTASIDLSGKANDDLIQFHIGCKEDIQRCNDTTSVDLTELNKFDKGPIPMLLIKSVSKRLGFDVNSGDINMMYRACIFGYALGDDDIWCSVFSTSNMKILEFDADIDDYYKDGYGNKLNYEQACPVVRNLVDLMKNATVNHSPKAVLYFSHAGAIKKVFTRFGLFRDDVRISANGICSQQSRRWRSSIIAPFNSNLAIVLFQCGRDHKLAAFHNEKRVLIDGCTDLLCPIEYFHAKYDSIAANCNVKSMCCKCCNDSELNS